jgi:hypothetical protein
VGGDDAALPFVDQGHGYRPARIEMSRAEFARG